jgi:hypothetical protein
MRMPGRWVLSTATVSTGARNSTVFSMDGSVVATTTAPFRTTFAHLRVLTMLPGGITVSSVR